MTKISVIIPTYNRKDFVVEAIQSVLQQEPKNFEVIVVDDGSIDETADYLHSLDLPITVISKENGGAASAKNEGIRNAQGKYIALLDSDDLWLPGILQEQSTYLDSHPEVGLVYVDEYTQTNGKRGGKTKFEIMNATPEQKTKFNRPNLIIPQAPLHTSAVMIRKSVFDEVGLFNEIFKLHDDTDMWNRISDAFPFGFIDKPLAIVRWKIDHEHLMKPQTRDKFTNELRISMQLFEDRHKKIGMSEQVKKDIEKSYERIDQIEYLQTLRKNEQISEKEFLERRKAIFTRSSKIAKGHF